MMIPMQTMSGMMVLRVITGMITQVTMMMVMVSEKTRMSSLVAVVVTGIPT